MRAITYNMDSGSVPVGSDPRALLLTADPLLARTVCRTLQPPYRITVGTDAGQGVDLALRVRPDVVLADAALPGLYPDGLLAALRRRHELQDVPVIALSTSAQAAPRARLLREGARDCIAGLTLATDELYQRVDALVTQRWTMLAMRHDEAAWRSLFEQASDGIFIADGTGRCTDVNPVGCAILQRTRDQIVGSTVWQLVPEFERARMTQARATALEGGSHTREWMMLRGDGSLVAVEVADGMLSDGRWLGFVRDVSQRRRRLQAAEDLAEQLERRVQERTAQLRRLAAELEQAESRERSQIARDLHDDLGQTLAAASIRLAPLCEHAQPEVRKVACIVAGLIEEAHRATRSLAAQLSPPVLYRLGLVPALEWLAEELGKSFRLAVTVDDDGVDKPLSQEARSIVYRAVRELLINVAKHARSNRATVQVASADGAMTVRVSDEGAGFAGDGPARAGPARGLGLRSVRERLSYIGGRFELRTAPGSGTEAVLTVPLAPPPPERGASP